MPWRERFGARRTAGDIKIYRDHGVNAATGGIVDAENASADAAGSDGD